MNKYWVEIFEDVIRQFLTDHPELDASDARQRLYFFGEGGDANSLWNQTVLRVLQ